MKLSPEEVARALEAGSRAFDAAAVVRELNAKFDAAAVVRKLNALTRRRSADAPPRESPFPRRRGPTRPAEAPPRGILLPRESPLIAQAQIDNPLIAYDKVWKGALKTERVSTQSADVTKFKPQTRSKLASWAPDLEYYDLILVNTSGGKDSAALMIRFNALLKTYPKEIRDRVVAIHSDLGIAEHPEVIQVVREHARLMDVPLVIVDPTITPADGSGTYDTNLFIEVIKRSEKVKSDRKAAQIVLDNPQSSDIAKAKAARDLLKHSAPGHGTRYCTNALKTRQITKWMNAWIRERAPKAAKTGNIITHYGRRVRVLNLLGLRAQESKGRAKAGFKIKGGKKGITSRKVVHEWLPIQFMETEDVWRSIQRQGYPYHAAYAAGFGRLSCTMCPLAGKEDLQLGMLTYPQMAQRMIALEDKYKFKWKERHSAKKLLELAESNPEMMKKARAARKILRRQGGPVMRYLQQGQVPLGSRNLEDLDQLILRFTQ